MVYSDPSGWIIDIWGMVSPDKGSEASSFCRRILEECPLRIYLFKVCCQFEPHRHTSLGDRGFPDAQYLLTHITSGEQPSFFPACGHRLDLILPQSMDNAPQLPVEKSKKSWFVTHARQIIERCNRRIKEDRLWRRPIANSKDMPPEKVLAWLRISAAMGNAFKDTLPTEPAQ